MKQICKYASIIFLLCFVVFTALFVREKNVEIQKVDQLIKQTNIKSDSVHLEDREINDTPVDEPVNKSRKTVFTYQIIAFLGLILSVMCFVIFRMVKKG
ncbi:hypothetical protein OCF62_28370 [Bacillus wiedmannii]|uniref:hypothetical protein n=1 Tax=Bacillus wiedmannii TaxID=1890302 RepID=UPI000BF9200C|nr:hypothetical protein [Bacillus wiedmannii]MCU5518409.1 hypothetical protein [Bacillus wiedmannii]PGD05838.1 hypothetical protein COM34_20955 [Bacillus wiedmannii]PGE25264.1 hypothetical protein COM52_28320 [Bacillus wiedmannii]